MRILWTKMCPCLHGGLFQMHLCRAHFFFSGHLPYRADDSGRQQLCVPVDQCRSSWPHESRWGLQEVPNWPASPSWLAWMPSRAQLPPAAPRWYCPTYYWATRHSSWGPTSWGHILGPGTNQPSVVLTTDWAVHVGQHKAFHLAHLHITCSCFSKLPFQTIDIPVYLCLWVLARYQVPWIGNAFAAWRNKKCTMSLFLT